LEYSVLDRESVVSRLAELFRGIESVEVAILFGSMARGGVAVRDVDIAVKFSRRVGLLDLGFIVSRVAEALGVSEDRIDLVDLDYASPILTFKVLSEGIVIKGSVEALRELAEKASLYSDTMVEVRQWSSLDPNPRLDKTVIVSRVEEIRRNARFLKERIVGKKPRELDYGEILALERAVHRIVEAMLDICRHLVAVYSLGLVESYSGYARKLAQAGIMPWELAEKVSKLAGLRNILVHRYAEVDVEKLHEVARDIVEGISRDFIEWVQSLTKDP